MWVFPNYPTFEKLRSALDFYVQSMAKATNTGHWQGRDISKKPDMIRHELLDVAIAYPVKSENLQFHRNDIKPNLPWADDHFEERVSGKPLNPGEQWRNWPWASSADRFRSDEIFNHTYMERFWPIYANNALEPRSGIRNNYGDLYDVVSLLIKYPHTTQAYLPMFFPEDTGIGDGDRKPCTLGYHFQMRDDKLNITYPIRSCDLIRHFNDDFYMAIRLLLWVLESCRERDPMWNNVEPGMFSMYIFNLHIFEADRYETKDKL